jgi:hypothetical protein
VINNDVVYDFFFFFLNRTSLAHHYGETDTGRYVDQVEKSAETTDFDPHYCDDNSSGPSASDCGLADLMALF